MPHIHALFVENEEVKMLLGEQKTAVREIVAKHTGYPLEAVAFIPNMVPRELEDLTENLLPLEFVIDVGLKCAENEERIVAGIKTDLLKLDFNLINFGIWLRVMETNAFSEHKPSK